MCIRDSPPTHRASKWTESALANGSVQERPKIYFFFTILQNHHKYNQNASKYSQNAPKTLLKCFQNPPKSSKIDPRASPKRPFEKRREKYRKRCPRPPNHHLHLGTLFGPKYEKSIQKNIEIPRHKTNMFVDATRLQNDPKIPPTIDASPSNQALKPGRLDIGRRLKGDIVFHIILIQVRWQRRKLFNTLSRKTHCSSLYG